jgi:hypothetical protein
VYSMQGIGQLLACGVVAVASYGVGYNWSGKPFPLSVSRQRNNPLSQPRLNSVMSEILKVLHKLLN